MIDAFWASLSAALLDQVTPLARFIVALVAGSSACLFLAGMAWVHRRRLKHIPIRIHVAGTRGKSTVTRLVAAGLRAGGHRVVAKTTGAQPQIIFPDGHEVPVPRWGAVSIREQFGFVRVAARERADAIVAEAMAIEPEYLGALARFYIRATDLLITNVRPDHQEQLGEDPEAMARAIAMALPPGGRVFVTAEAATPLVRAQAHLLGCRLSIVDDDADLDPEAANLALARAICRHYGIEDAAIEAAMRAAQRDIGSFTLKPLAVAGRMFSFANAFSCNDTELFRRLWRRHHPETRPVAFLFNARSDRPLRSSAFLRLLPELAPEAALYVTQGSRALQRSAVKHGFTPDRVHLLPRASAEEQLTHIARDVANDTVIWGAGNFKGAGADMTAFVNAAARSC